MQGVGLLDHVVILFLFFGGTTVLFSIVVARFYILINSAQRFQFLQFLLVGNSSLYYFSLHFCLQTDSFFSSFLFQYLIIYSEEKHTGIVSILLGIPLSHLQQVHWVHFLFSKYHR